MNDAVMVPADVIKQRLQISQVQYRGVLDCIMQTWRHEGLGAFYRQACSAPCALASIPFQSLPWTWHKRRAFQNLRVTFLERLAHSAGKADKLAQSAGKACCSIAGGPVLGGAVCRSYPVTLFMNIPWVILHFPLYETSKQLLAPPQQRNEGPAAQIAAGGIAGGVAAALVSSAEQPRSQIMQDAT